MIGQSAIATNVAALMISAAAGGTPATHINDNSYHITTTATQTFPTGAQSGDIALLWMYEGAGAVGDVTSPGNAGASWTRIDRTSVGTHYFGLYGKVLNSNDVGATPGFSITSPDAGNSTSVAIYRGPGTFTLKSTPATSSSANTLTITGFSPAGNSAGVFVASIDKNDAAAGTLVGNTGAFTQRVSIHEWSQDHYSMDELSGYAAANIAITGYSSTAEKIAWAVEFTP